MIEFGNLKRTAQFWQTRESRYAAGCGARLTVTKTLDREPIWLGIGALRNDVHIDATRSADPASPIFRREG